MTKRKPKMTDTERLDWLEKAEGWAVVSDDGGRWACVTSGFQNVPERYPTDIHATFFIRKKEWKPSVRAAIDAAIRNYGKD